LALDRHLLLVEAPGLGAAACEVGAVVEIIGGASDDAEEMVVSTLERPEVRQGTEMPFADQRGAVADFFE
jgi:hypothetical protein